VWIASVVVAVPFVFFSTHVAPLQYIVLAQSLSAAHAPAARHRFEPTPQVPLWHSAAPRSGQLVVWRASAIVAAPSASFAVHVEVLARQNSVLAQSVSEAQPQRVPLHEPLRQTTAPFVASQVPPPFAYPHLPSLSQTPLAHSTPSAGHVPV
jgi:hypothetical protein